MAARFDDTCRAQGGETKKDAAQLGGNIEPTQL
jgi:hypothetical protein